MRKRWNSASIPVLRGLRLALTGFVIACAVSGASAQSSKPGKKKPAESTKKEPEKKAKGPGRTPEPRIVAPGQTEITASGSSQFDNKTHVAVFIQDVVVADARFTLYCDRLTVYMKAKQETPGKAGKMKGDAPGTGGIDHALAEANPGSQVIIVQDKAEADGKITRSVGRGDRATFDSGTGNLVLTGNPSLQRGATYTVPAEGGTVITLNRKGDMLIKGATRTLLQDLDEVDKKKP